MRFVSLRRSDQDQNSWKLVRLINQLLIDFIKIYTKKSLVAKIGRRRENVARAYGKFMLVSGPLYADQ